MTTINDNEDSIAIRIDLSRSSSYQRLLRVATRVLAMHYKSSNLSLRNMCRPLTANNLEDACMLWVQEVKKLLLEKFRRGEFKRLGVKIKKDGLLTTSS